MDIRTFAVFPDEKFKYGGIAYIGALNMDAKQLREFMKNDSFCNYIKNKKLRKCFDSAYFYTEGEDEKNRKIYFAAYRFYPPLLWSRKKIASALEESFDICKIG